MAQGHTADEDGLTAWIEREIGGTVVRIEQLARWRPAWDIDLERDGAILPLHARGDREANFAIPTRIADEVPAHQLLEAAGLPVPHVYGLSDTPYALVMDRLPGRVELSFADSEEQRSALIDEYLHMLPVVYGVDLADAERAGFARPTDARGVALGSFMRFEAAYDALGPPADPVAVFLRRWLHRNYPRDRAEPRFVTYDAFQFMYENGRITGLLDFELAHVGDPLMDLAALRIRDTIKSLGDLPAIAERYADVTGIAVDHDAIDFHTVLYNTCTVLSAGPPLAAPMSTTDYVSHLAWYVNSARWAFEVMAEMLGVELAVVEPLAPGTSSHRPAFQHLTDGMRRLTGASGGDYQTLSLSRLARHLARVADVGAQARSADLDDLAALLGHRPAEQDADGVLVRFIEQAPPEDDARLLRLLDRRMQRLHLLMGPEGSLLLRHPRLRSLRPGAAQADDDAGWPAGAIPGTA